MANNPNNLSDIIEVDAAFIPPTATGTFGFSNPVFVSEFASSPSFPDRIKAYTGTLANKQDALVADGFATTSKTYRQVTSGGRQGGPPRTIFVGRKDAVDADWPAALNAVKADANLKQLGYYAIAVTTRDVFDLEDIENWVDGEFAFFLGQTNNLGVRNNTPGNLAEIVLAKNRTNPRMALLWHDPATASNLGPATLTSATETYSIADASTLLLRVDDGVEQSFDFNAAAAAITGSNTETFIFADGDQLDVAIDSASPQTITFDTSSATLLAGATETYNILPNSLLNVRVDGGVVQPVTFQVTAGAVTTSAEPFALNDLETVTFNIDGSGNQVVTFNAADFAAIGAATAAEVAAVYATQLTGVTITATTGVTVTSNRFGTSSDVEIVGGTGTALTELGYVVANNVGTGFAAFADVATAAEVFAEINTDTVGLTAVEESSSVRLTSDAIGTGSRLQVLSGVANDALLFGTNEVTGTGDFVDATAALAQEVVDKISATLAGAVASVLVDVVVLTSRTLGNGSKVEIFASTVATTLGLAVSVVTGTGDFFNAAQATASEVANHIGLTLTGATASTISSAVVLESATNGDMSELEITGGTLVSTLAFADSAGNLGRARGTGTDEDFLDCAWIGRCITFDLDAPNGAAVWDDHHLDGVFADKDLTEVDRFTLEETLKVNTYRNRNGRDETHTGTMLNNNLGGGRYIDVRTTLDWIKARTVERFKRVFDRASDAKQKESYSNSGVIATLANEWRQLHVDAERFGHIFFQDKTLDPSDADSVGIFIPTVAQQTQEDKDNRLVAGFQTRQPIQAAGQRAKATIELVGPIE